MRDGKLAPPSAPPVRTGATTVWPRMDAEQIGSAEWAQEDYNWNGVRLTFDKPHSIAWHFGDQSDVVALSWQVAMTVTRRPKGAWGPLAMSSTKPYNRAG